MPRPKKIRKKKSFMFTSRHYSFIGNLAMLLAVCSFVGFFGAVFTAYMNVEKGGKGIGSVGLFGVIMNITGVIASVISLRERDIYVWLPRTALFFNLFDILIWALIAAWGM